MVEVVVDLLEGGNDRAAERGDAVEDEEVRVAARRELVVEEDVDALLFARAPRHLAGQAVGGGGTGGNDVGVGRREARVEPDVDAERPRLREETAVERSLLRAAADEPAVRLIRAHRA